MLTSDMSNTINITITVTRTPSMSCLKVLLLASLGYESETNPHELYVADELESFRSLMGVIEISEWLRIVG